MPIVVLKRLFRKCQTCHSHEVVECFEIRTANGNTLFPCREHLNALLSKVSDDVSINSHDFG